MVGAQRPAPGRAAAPATAGAPRGRSPLCSVNIAMLFRLMRVSGWSAPSDPHLVGQQPLRQPERLAGITALLGEHRDVAPGGEGVGMVGAQDPLLVGQQLLQQPERLAGITALLGEARDVAPGGEGVGVVGAQ